VVEYFKILKQKRLQAKGLYLIVKTKLIGAGVRDSCGKSASKGDPTGAKAPRRLQDRPRKASALRSNQRSNF
ncbi:hypothetical protein ABES08_17165, partial [Peribacillus simplex]|uniref:hypothetical protein n=1 Tax=Peribacillus simplex TaxID=1478 RepID=UPI003D26B1BE